MYSLKRPRHHAGRLHARRRHQLVEGDDRAGADLVDLAAHAELGQHALQHPGVLAQRALVERRERGFGLASMASSGSRKPLSAANGRLGWLLARLAARGLRRGLGRADGERRGVELGLRLGRRVDGRGDVGARPARRRTWAGGRGAGLAAAARRRGWKSAATWARVIAKADSRSPRAPGSPAR